MLLSFFILSSAWSAASFGLLRVGGEMPLAVGSAVLLPTTLLAFIRPVSLPYSWAAPPQSLSGPEAHAAALLVASLIIYHAAVYTSIRRAREPALPLLLQRVGEGGDSASRERVTLNPTELVGPSLRL